MQLVKFILFYSADLFLSFLLGIHNMPVKFYSLTSLNTSELFFPFTEIK